MARDSNLRTRAIRRADGNTIQHQGKIEKSRKPKRKVGKRSARGQRR